MRYQNANTSAYFEDFCKKIILNKVSGYRSYIISIHKFGQKHPANGLNNKVTSNKEKDINARSKDKLELLITRLEKVISIYN